MQILFVRWRKISKSTSEGISLGRKKVHLLCEQSVYGSTSLHTRLMSVLNPLFTPGGFSSLSNISKVAFGWTSATSLTFHNIYLAFIFAKFHSQIFDYIIIKLPCLEADEKNTVTNWLFSSFVAQFQNFLYKMIKLTWRQIDICGILKNTHRSYKKNGGVVI